MKKFNINNRRYIGNKSKLLEWIFEKIRENTIGSSFFDVFSGTGSVSKEALNYYDEIIINDFLFSNNVMFPLCMPCSFSSLTSFSPSSNSSVALNGSIFFTYTEALGLIVRAVIFNEIAP